MRIDATAANWANQDAWATAHGQDGYYDLDAVVAGRDLLTDVELAALELALGARLPGRPTWQTRPTRPV